MIVYVLEWVYEYEPGYIEGVYATLELAMANKPKWVTEEWEKGRFVGENYWSAGYNLYIYPWKVFGSTEPFIDSDEFEPTAKGPAIPDERAT